MVKILRTVMAVVLILTLSVQFAFAATYVTMYGKAESAASDVTILMLKQGTDINNLVADDIAYVNQYSVNSDGSFAIQLPFFDVGNYDIRSNMDFDIHTGDATDTVYVSPASGSDDNDGKTAQTPFATLAAAYSQLFRVDEIVLMDDTTYAEVPAHTSSLTIKGNTPSVQLTVPSSISLCGPLTVDNLSINGASTIYANGYALKIGGAVTAADTTKRLTVYGGKQSTALTGDTNVELLGGLYAKVFGGGNGGVVNGNTNVIFGGTANSIDSITGGASNYSTCSIYGGGNGAAVSGETNITLDGNAVALYVIGAGTGTGATAKETNVYIKGGKAMNVYGGSKSVELTNCNTNVTMTGGLVEGVFGGSEFAPITGNTYVTLKGGDVSRRVYSGSYNDWSLTWKTNYYVTGTTTLVIYPEIDLLTKTELDSGDALNMGVFSGSRSSSNESAENNTLIYLDGAYDTQSTHLVTSGIFKSHHDYTVTANAGGEVVGTTTPGTVKIIPDKGYTATLNSNVYKEETSVALGSSTATVTFSAPDYNINSVTAKKEDTKVSGSADILGSSTVSDAKLMVVVYEKDTNRLVSCAAQPATVSGSKGFELNCNFENGKTYIVKAMIWDESALKPLTMYYTINL